MKKEIYDYKFTGQRGMLSFLINQLLQFAGHFVLPEQNIYPLEKLETIFIVGFGNEKTAIKIVWENCEFLLFPGNEC